MFGVISLLGVALHGVYHSLFPKLLSLGLEDILLGVDAFFGG